MARQLDDLITKNSEGPFANPFNPKMGAAVWRVPGAGFYASEDAGLFSSSLPVFPHMTFAKAEQEDQYAFDNFTISRITGQGVKDKGPLEGFEKSQVRRLLPNNEVELLADLMDDFDLNELPSQLEDLEEYDLFGSGGGMELDSDPQESLVVGMPKVSLSHGITANGIDQYAVSAGTGTGALAGEHPLGEHPSRTLFVRNINSNVEDSHLRSLFEEYGDIRTLYTACKHRGFVMISYYDIRAARNAMRALQNKSLRRRKLDIHFSIPKDNPSEKDVNQGTLVVFNLDTSVSNDELRRIFGAYGEVKEIRETPHKRHHKFVEFYDVRDAEAALKALNRSEVGGKRIKLEPSRPGGARRNLLQQLSQEMGQDETRSFRHPIGSLVASPPLGNWTQLGNPVEQNPHSLSNSPVLGSANLIKRNTLPGLASGLPPYASSCPNVTAIVNDQQTINHVNHINSQIGSPGVACLHSRSFQEQNLGTRLGSNFSIGESLLNSTGVHTLPGPNFIRASQAPYSKPVTKSAWTTSSVQNLFGSSGQGKVCNNREDYFPRLCQSHHVGSAPTGVPPDRHFGFFGGSPDLSLMSSISIERLGSIHNDGNYQKSLGGNATGSSSIGIQRNMRQQCPDITSLLLPRHSPTFPGNCSYPGLGEGGSDELAEQFQNWRLTGVSQVENKQQYQLVLEKIIKGEDCRTTLMIKNIPNKYTSKMLLAEIDETHRGAYDFLYLPIDFKNKCNVGYAFINMVSPTHILRFYKTFNGKKWENFNSEKVASLAYARIQGKNALITHFQNSSLMNENKQCRPILFHSEGQEPDDQASLISVTSNLQICTRLADGSYSADVAEKPNRK